MPREPQDVLSRTPKVIGCDACVHEALVLKLKNRTGGERGYCVERGFVSCGQRIRLAYVRSVAKGTAWMFACLFFSYIGEFAYIFLIPTSPAAMQLLPAASYAPVAFTFWRVTRE